DVVDVDPAGGDVGGDEHVHLSAAERAQGLLASTLAEIPVQGSGSEPAIDEILGHAGGGTLCAHEDDRQTAAAGLQHAGDEFHFVQRVGPVGELGHGFDRGGVVGGVRGADVGGAGHVAARHRDDGAGHRRGEQHRVSVRGGGGQQRFDVGKEPEVEHLVGLVEHDGPHRAEVQVALVEQVDHPARGAHDHFHAPFQGFDLWFVGAPAVHLQDPQAPALRGRLQITGDLDREFAGGHDDERLRLAGVLQVLPAVLAGPDDPLEHGDAEPEGLARAGLCLADDVVARERDRQGERLYGERVGDADVAQRVDDGFAHGEVCVGLVWLMCLRIRNFSCGCVGHISSRQTTSRYAFSVVADREHMPSKAREFHYYPKRQDNTYTKTLSAEGKKWDR